MMKNKKFLGSVLVALLMLLTAIATINTVVSDPTQHTGDAWVGDLWISELDVSGELEYVDNIGIGHVRADDDWVQWTNWAGDIKANWTIDIDSNSHPEYWVVYKLTVFNIDNENTEVGNTTYETTLAEDRTYNTSGTLSLSINLSDTGSGKADQTLVCYLGAVIKVNDTYEYSEVENFTCMADDRCVVGVSSSSSEQPFSRFPNEANDEWPPMWSWLPDWDQAFSTETEMFNEQTFFNVGEQSPPQSGVYENEDWDLGDVMIYLQPFSGDFVFTPDVTSIEWGKTTGDWLVGYTYMTYDVDETPNWDHFPFLIRYKLWYELAHNGGVATYPPGAYDYWEEGDSTPTTFGRDIAIKDKNIDGEVAITGWLWAVGGVWFDISGITGTVTIDGEATASGYGNSTSYYWEDECCYQNDSYSLNISSNLNNGINTVTSDISDILDEANEFIYCYAGDSGPTRVSFTC